MAPLGDPIFISIGELRTKMGFPYDTFPTDMMKYGGGGVAGWGSLCATLNGVAAAIYLLTRIIHEKAQRHDRR